MLGATGQKPGLRGQYIYSCVGQMLTLFSCYVHGKDVAGSKVRALGQGFRSGGQSPESETLLAFERAMEAANSPVLIFENAKKLTNICIFCKIDV